MPLPPIYIPTSTADKLGEVMIVFDELLGLNDQVFRTSSTREQTDTQTEREKNSEEERATWLATIGFLPCGVQLWTAHVQHDGLQGLTL
eukprot:6185821-Pleurochrysis_carterae.AAC.3